MATTESGNLKIITFSKKPCDFSEFVESWSKAYDKTYEEQNYYKPLYKSSKGEEDIRALYIWKNGMMKLSRQKESCLRNKILNKNKLSIINELSKSFSEDSEKEFRKEFKNIPAIWKIFLMHIIKHDKYPMFDQYVYRSYWYIKYGLPEGKSLFELNNREKENFYFENYIKFFRKIEDEVRSKYTSKQIDEALWAFGKFLKSDFSKLLG